MIRAVAALLLSSGAAGAACSDGVVDLRWPDGSARFTVEVADTDAERATGLMNRPSMPKSAGMLFIYEHPQDVAFWMKNTLIPLDMVFFTAEGRVAKVHAEAVPGDLTPIPGAPETLMVLEINGGLARRIGVTEGAEMRHPGLDQATALWPCE